LSKELWRGFQKAVREADYEGAVNYAGAILLLSGKKR